jgi:4-diphosphocytidyl-2C-methyl-D-erythritol kinase
MNIDEKGTWPMIVKAHAKINVALNVLNKRSDGYHNLDMVMLPLELHDTVEVEMSPSSIETVVTVDGIELPAGSNNLAAVAVTKMRELYRFNENFKIHIQKRIPMAAGLGGGSSDAAAVVRAIIELLKLPTRETDIINICRSIGSDVPFFYRQMAARVRGTGEILTPISIKNGFDVLIIKPKQGLSTKTVFSKYDENPMPLNDIDPVIKALKAGDDESLAKSIFNQLQPAAASLCPEITTIIDALHKDGFGLVQMTGSGSAVFVLSRHSAQLEPAAVKYGESGYEVMLTRLKAEEQTK